jgi:hypothetical protein
MYQGRPKKIKDFRHFSETWQEDGKGKVIDVVRKRKSKKRHPDMEPLPLPGYLPK